MTIEDYKLEKDRLENLVNECDAKIIKFTEFKLSESGLVTEPVRLSDEYRILLREFNFYFGQLRNFNSQKQCVEYAKQIYQEKRKSIQK